MRGKKIFNYFIFIIEIISVISISILAITLFFSVITRYVFSYSIPELEAVRKFAIMWLVFVGSAVAIRENSHLKIDIISDYLTEKLKNFQQLIVYVIVFISIILLIMIGIEVFETGLTRQELISIRFLSESPSKIYYYSAFLIGSIFMLFTHLSFIKKIFKTNWKEK